MLPITLTATIDENHRLILDLPDDIPAGEVEVVIRPLLVDEITPLSSTSGELTREEIRAKLKAAGLLVEGPFAPPDAVELTPEERERIGRLAAQGRSTLDLINEDREERF